MDPELKEQYDALSPDVKQFVDGHMARVEGVITARWHQWMQDTGLDLGDSIDENLYFMCFRVGASEGSILTNQVWEERCDALIQEENDPKQEQEQSEQSEQTEQTEQSE